MICAMFIMPLLDVVAKFLGQQGVPIIQIVWARLVFGMLMTAPAVAHGEGIKALVPTQLPLHLARAVLVVMSTMMFFWALKFQGVAETLSIFFVQPLVITIFSPLILGERVGVRRWLAVAVGFLGTLIIIRPGFQDINPGMVLSLGAGVCSGLYMTLSRKLAGTSSAMANTFYTSGIGAIISSVIVMFFWATPSLKQWGMFALLSFLATSGNFIILRAYAHAEASLLAPFGYTEMIMAVAAGWYFFNDFPDAWTFLGVAVLIACAIYISLRERHPAIVTEEPPPYT